MKVLYFLAAILFIANTAPAQTGPNFSSLPMSKQYQMRDMVATPDTFHRYGCYSTPNYYLCNEGYEYKGDLDEDPNTRCYTSVKGKKGPNYGYWKLDRNHPEWQEAMLKNWAELGLNNTHLNIYPEDNSLSLSSSYKKSIQDYVALSEKYGLKVGVRLDALGDYEAWEMNPTNPANRIADYKLWVTDIATILKGKTAYYILGDELTLYKDQSTMLPQSWTPDTYLEYFKQISTTIKKTDPQAKVSMFGAESGKWSNVLYLLEKGYAKYGDAVAINYYNYQDITKFFDDARKLAPDLLFLSNGVGYTSNGTVTPRYPEGDYYSAYPTEEQHAYAVAKNMFAWWDLGAATAPYYITLRNWVINDKVYPRWFGFFGIEDFIIDKYDNLTVKKYPSWYAFQTIANTFYNRDQFCKPTFKVTSSSDVSMFRAYCHKVNNSEELLIMVWNDKEPVKTTITIGSADFKFPVAVSIFNYNKWSNVDYNISDTGTVIDTIAEPKPQIIRLFSVATDNPIVKK
jgi:hypothetical protein